MISMCWIRRLSATSWRTTNLCWPIARNQPKRLRDE
nr:MAG TPA_asm: hypothetical protein [Caudoviricetes sp.]